MDVWSNIRADKFIVPTEPGMDTTNRIKVQASIGRLSNMAVTIHGQSYYYYLFVVGLR